MANIIVLGAGLGGIVQAFELRRELSSAHTVSVINEGERFEFTPSNPWVGVGWRKPSEIVVELPALFGKHGIEFHSAGAKRVHPDQNQVELKDGSRLDYDYLVIATGPKLAFDEVPGLGPDGGYTQSVCKTDHAEACHENFEALARDPGPVIVGAAAGASCFGPAYEYAFIVDRELKRRGIRDRVPMYFVTPEPYIGHLGLDGVGDTKGLLESELRNANIHWVTNARIDSVEENVLHATEVDEQGDEVKVHDLEFRHAMILPAFRGVDAVDGIEGLVNPRGFVTIDEFQRNERFNNVYSIGVCVAIPPMGGTPLAVGVPKTGYMIESMATAVTRNIGEVLEGGSPSHRASWNALCLADFGKRGVAFVALPQIPPRNLNWASRGRWVHWAKVLFEKYFLYKVRRGRSESAYERLVLVLFGIRKLKITG
ncbi:MAG TPA: FAD-dependent oxidoreductase [Arenicellales bacterium]|nr:FAD-dependent oxidoreductase [Arenicellales bacterium]